jgi:hypothetical protein
MYQGDKDSQMVGLCLGDSNNLQYISHLERAVRVWNKTTQRDKECTVEHDSIKKCSKRCQLDML